MLIFVFGLDEAARAAGSAGSSMSGASAAGSAGASRALDLAGVIRRPSLIPVPADAVHAERFIAGSNGRLVILLRDAHTNLGAQKNIHRAIDRWSRDLGTSLILSEGASGEAGLAGARAALGAEELDRAADRLLWRALITGHEHLTLLSDRPLRIVGIEDDRTYRRAWEVFRRMTDGRQKVADSLTRSRAAVDGMKRRDYPHALLAHEAAAGAGADWVERYRSVRELADRAELGSDTAFAAATAPFETLKQMEKSVDTERLAFEQERAFSEARVRCGSCADDLTDRFREAGRSLPAVLSAVQELARASGRESWNSDSELGRYERYLEAVSALELDPLLESLDEMEERIYAKLAPADDARRTRFIDRHTRLLESAYALRLTPSEVRRLDRELEAVRPVSWQAELNDRAIEQGRPHDLLAYEPQLVPRLTAVKNFYRLAALRDKVFVRRADGILSETGERSSVLIAGGYHTEHLTQLLAQRGYSVAVFTPRVDAETDAALYERTVLNSNPASGPAAPSRSALLAPLARTPGGRARLERALPGLPTDAARLASAIVSLPDQATLSPQTSVEPVRSAAVPAGARMNPVPDTFDAVRYAPVFDRLADWLKRPDGRMSDLAVSGVPAAGKTTFAERFADHLRSKGQDVQVIHGDRFILYGRRVPRLRIAFDWLAGALFKSGDADRESRIRNLVRWTIDPEAARAFIAAVGQVRSGAVVEAQVKLPGTRRFEPVTLTLRRDTVLIFENVLAEHLVQTLNARTMLVEVGRQTAREVFLDRARKMGMSPLRALIKSWISLPPDFFRYFEHQKSRSRYGAVLNLNDRSRPELEITDPADGRRPMVLAAVAAARMSSSAASLSGALRAAGTWLKRAVSAPSRAWKGARRAQDFEYFGRFTDLDNSGRLDADTMRAIGRMPYNAKIRYGYYLRNGKVYIAYGDQKAAAKRLRIHDAAAAMGFENLAEVTRLSNGLIVTRIAQTYSDDELRGKQNSLEDLFLYQVLFADLDHYPHGWDQTDENVHRRTLRGDGPEKTAYLVYDNERAYLDGLGHIRENRAIVRQLFRMIYQRNAPDRDAVMSRIRTLNLSEDRRKTLADVVDWLKVTREGSGARMAGLASRPSRAAALHPVERFEEVLGVDRISLLPGVYPRLDARAVSELDVEQSVNAAVSAVRYVESSGIGADWKRRGGASPVRLREIGAGAGIALLAWLTYAERSGIRVQLDADDIDPQALKNVRRNLALWSRHKPGRDILPSSSEFRVRFANGSSVRLRRTAPGRYGFVGARDAYSAIYFNAPIVTSAEFDDEEDDDPALVMRPAELSRILKSAVPTLAPGGVLLMESSVETFDGRYPELRQDVWNGPGDLVLRGLPPDEGEDTVRSLFVMERSGVRMAQSDRVLKRSVVVDPFGWSNKTYPAIPSLIGNLMGSPRPMYSERKSVNLARLIWILYLVSCAIPAWIFGAIIPAIPAAHNFYQTRLRIIQLTMDLARVPGIDEKIETSIRAFKNRLAEDPEFGGMHPTVKRLERLLLRMAFGGSRRIKPVAIAYTATGQVRVFFKEPHLLRFLAPLDPLVPRWIEPLEGWKPLRTKLKEGFAAVRQAMTPVPSAPAPEPARVYASLSPEIGSGARMAGRRSFAAGLGALAGSLLAPRRTSAQEGAEHLPLSDRKYDLDFGEVLPVGWNSRLKEGQVQALSEPGRQIVIEPIWDGECVILLASSKRDPRLIAAAHLTNGSDVNDRIQKKVTRFGSADLEAQYEDLTEYLRTVGLKPEDAVFKFLRYGPSHEENRVDGKPFAEAWRDLIARRTGTVPETREVRPVPSEMNGRPASRNNVMRRTWSYLRMRADGVFEVRQYADATVRESGDEVWIVDSEPVFRAEVSAAGFKDLPLIRFKDQATAWLLSAAKWSVPATAAAYGSGLVVRLARSERSFTRRELLGLMREDWSWLRGKFSGPRTGGSSGARMAGDVGRDRALGEGLKAALDTITRLDVFERFASSAFIPDDGWPAPWRLAESIERSGSDLGGFRYLNHGMRYVVFEHDAHPGLVFKTLKRSAPLRIYYEAWLNHELIAMMNPGLRPADPGPDPSAWPMLRLPSVAGYAFGGGIGHEFIVQEKAAGRKTLASEAQPAIRKATEALEALGVHWTDWVTGNFNVLDDGGIVVVDTGDNKFTVSASARQRLLEGTELPAGYEPPSPDAVDRALRQILNPGEFQLIFNEWEKRKDDDGTAGREEIRNGIRPVAVFYDAIASGASPETAARKSLQYAKWLKAHSSTAAEPPAGSRLAPGVDRRTAANIAGLGLYLGYVFAAVPGLMSFTGEGFWPIIGHLWLLFSYVSGTFFIVSWAVEFISPSPEDGRSLKEVAVRSIKEDVLRKALERGDYRLVRGLRGTGVRIVGSGFGELAKVMSPGKADGDILIPEALSGRPAFDQIVRYLLIRRAVGAEYDRVADEAFRAEGFSGKLIGSTQLVWYYLGDFEDLKRVRYYPLMLPYILMHAVFSGIVLAAFPGSVGILTYFERRTARAMRTYLPDFVRASRSVDPVLPEKTGARMTSVSGEDDDLEGGFDVSPAERFAKDFGYMGDEAPRLVAWAGSPSGAASDIIGYENEKIHTVFVSRYQAHRATYRIKFTLAPAESSGGPSETTLYLKRFNDAYGTPVADDHPFFHDLLDELDREHRLTELAAQRGLAPRSRMIGGAFVSRPSAKPELGDLLEELSRPDADPERARPAVEAIARALAELHAIREEGPPASAGTQRGLVHGDLAYHWSADSELDTDETFPLQSDHLRVDSAGERAEFIDLSQAYFAPADEMKREADTLASALVQAIGDERVKQWFGEAYAEHPTPAHPADSGARMAERQTPDDPRSSGTPAARVRGPLYLWITLMTAIGLTGVFWIGNERAPRTASEKLRRELTDVQNWQRTGVRIWRTETWISRLVRKPVDLPRPDVVSLEMKIMGLKRQLARSIVIEEMGVPEDAVGETVLSTSPEDGGLRVAVARDGRTDWIHFDPKTVRPMADVAVEAAAGILGVPAGSLAAEVSMESYRSMYGGFGYRPVRILIRDASGTEVLWLDYRTLKPLPYSGARMAAEADAVPVGPETVARILETLESRAGWTADHLEAFDQGMAEYADAMTSGSVSTDPRQFLREDLVRDVGSVLPSPADPSRSFIYESLSVLIHSRKQASAVRGPTPLGPTAEQVITAARPDLDFLVRNYRLGRDLQPVRAAIEDRDFVLAADLLTDLMRDFSSAYRQELARSAPRPADLARNFLIHTRLRVVRSIVRLAPPDERARRRSLDISLERFDRMERDKPSVLADPAVDLRSNLQQALEEIRRNPAAAARRERLQSAGREAEFRALIKQYLESERLVHRVNSAYISPKHLEAYFEVGGGQVLSSSGVRALYPDEILGHGETGAGGHNSFDAFLGTDETVSTSLEVPFRMAGPQQSGFSITGILFIYRPEAKAIQNLLAFDMVDIVQYTSGVAFGIDKSEAGEQIYDMEGLSQIREESAMLGGLDYFRYLSLIPGVSGPLSPREVRVPGGIGPSFIDRIVVEDRIYHSIISRLSDRPELRSKVVRESEYFEEHPDGSYVNEELERSRQLLIKIREIDAELTADAPARSVAPSTPPAGSRLAAFRKIFTGAAWAAFAVSAVLSAPVFAEGAEFWKQFSWVLAQFWTYFFLAPWIARRVEGQGGRLLAAGGLIGLIYLAFHVLPTGSEAWSHLAESLPRIAQRSAVVFVSMFAAASVLKTAEDRMKGHPFAPLETAAFASRWSLLPAIVSGFLVYYVFVPFTVDALPDAADRVRWDLTWGTLLATLPNKIASSSLSVKEVRSGRDLAAGVLKTWARLLPINFVYFSCWMTLGWWAAPGMSRFAQGSTPLEVLLGATEIDAYVRILTFSSFLFRTFEIRNMRRMIGREAPSPGGPAASDSSSAPERSAGNAARDAAAVSARVERTRDLSDADLAAVYRLQSEMPGDFMPEWLDPGSLIGSPAPDLIARLREDAGDGELVIARDAETGQLVGFASYGRSEGSEELYVHVVSVVPERRGSGAFEAMMERLADLAGAAMITMTVIREKKGDPTAGPRPYRLSPAKLRAILRKPADQEKAAVPAGSRMARAQDEAFNEGFWFAEAEGQGDAPAALEEKIAEAEIWRLRVGSRILQSYYAGAVAGYESLVPNAPVSGARISIGMEKLEVPDVPPGLLSVMERFVDSGQTGLERSIQVRSWEDYHNGAVKDFDPARVTVHWAGAPNSAVRRAAGMVDPLPMGSYEILRMKDVIGPEILSFLKDVDGITRLHASEYMKDGMKVYDIRTRVSAADQASTAPGSLPGVRKLIFVFGWDASRKTVRLFHGGFFVRGHYLFPYEITAKRRMEAAMLNRFVEALESQALLEAVPERVIVRDLIAGREQVFKDTGFTVEHGSAVRELKPAGARMTDEDAQVRHPDLRALTGLDAVFVMPGIYPRQTMSPALDADVEQSMGAIRSTVRYVREKKLFGGVPSDRPAKIWEIGTASGLGVLAWLSLAEAEGRAVEIDADDLYRGAEANLMVNVLRWSAADPGRRAIRETAPDRIVFENGSAVRFRLASLDRVSAGSEERYDFISMNAPSVRDGRIAERSGDQAFVTSAEAFSNLLRGIIDHLGPSGVALVQTSKSAFNLSDSRVPADWFLQNRYHYSVADLDPIYPEERRLFAIRRTPPSGARMSSPIQDALRELEDSRGEIERRLQDFFVGFESRLGHSDAVSLTSLLTDRFVNRPYDHLRVIAAAGQKGSVARSDLSRIREELRLDAELVDAFLDPALEPRLRRKLTELESGRDWSDPKSAAQIARLLREVLASEASTRDYYEVSRPLRERHHEASAKVLERIGALPVTDDGDGQRAWDAVAAKIGRAIRSSAPDRRVVFVHAPARFRMTELEKKLAGPDHDAIRGFQQPVDRFRWSQFFIDPRNSAGDPAEGRELVYFVHDAGRVDWNAWVLDLEARVPEIRTSAEWLGTRRELLGASGARMADPVKVNVTADRRIAAGLARPASLQDLAAGVSVSSVQTLNQVRRLPGLFAIPVTLPSGETVAALVAPVISEPGHPDRSVGFEVRSDRQPSRSVTDIKLAGPAPVRIVVESSAAASEAASEDRVRRRNQILMVLAQRMKQGDPRYAVHEVSGYWNADAADGDPSAADTAYLKHLASLATAANRWADWHVRFTYRGRPIHDPIDPSALPEGWTQNDADRFDAARDRLAAVQFKYDLPAAAHVIGDLTDADADRMAADPAALLLRGWKGAVISRAGALRSPVDTLMLQWALSTSEPIRDDEPVVAFLRYMTGHSHGAKEANWMRQGELVRMREQGWSRFTILPMAARMAAVLEAGARSIFESGISA